MKTIYKYPLKIEDIQIVSLPENSKFLHVDNQNGNLCLWAEVETDSQHNTNHNIAIIGTAHPIPSFAKKYIGTAIIHPFVWHVYTDR